MSRRNEYFGGQDDVLECVSMEGSGIKEPRLRRRRKESKVAIGRFRSFVLDVNDLESAERFWTAVLGWDLQFTAYNGQYSRLGEKGGASLLLQLVPEPKTELKNRGHLDITVDDVASASDDAVALGARVLKGPAFHPDDGDPLLEWAILADPSGNEFCVIREVHPTL